MSDMRIVILGPNLAEISRRMREELGLDPFSKHIIPLSWAFTSNFWKVEGLKDMNYSVVGDEKMPATWLMEVNKRGWKAHSWPKVVAAVARWAAEPASGQE